jgi:hypothetical protein
MQQDRPHERSAATITTRSVPLGAAATPLQVVFADFLNVVGAIDNTDPRTRAVALDLISRRVHEERERHRPLLEEWGLAA